MFERQLGLKWYHHVFTFPGRLQLYPEHFLPFQKTPLHHYPSVGSQPSQWPLKHRWKMAGARWYLQASQLTLAEVNSPNTSMPVQKEPYRYMTQSSSEGFSPMSRLATPGSVARPVRGGFIPDEKESQPMKNF